MSWLTIGAIWLVAIVAGVLNIPVSMYNRAKRGGRRRRK